MQVVKVFCHISKVSGGSCPSERAQLVMGRLEHLLEHGLVQVRLPLNVLLARLFDLDDDRDDDEDDDDAGSHPYDCPAGVGQLIQEAGLPLLYHRKESKDSSQSLTGVNRNG